MDAKRCNLTMPVPISKDSNKNVQKNLIEFIEDGKKYLTNLKVEKKAIMVLGLSGTGKSTLVNYLNNAVQMFDLHLTDSLLGPKKSNMNRLLSS